MAPHEGHDHPTHPSTNPEPPSKPAKPAKGKSGTLNLILHGLYAAFERKNGILALVPNLDSHHVYRAGTWLAETTIEPGEHFVLEGVTAGSARFPRNKNLIIQRACAKPYPGGKQLYASFFFPWPRKIHSVRSVQVDPKCFTGTSADRVAGKKLATVQIFQYKYKDHLQLKLGSHPWKPNPVDGTVNLHIWSEPETESTDSHSSHAFRQAISLFRKVDLALDCKLIAQNVDPAELPSGVAPEEIEDLDKRTARLAKAGALLLSGGDPRQAWQTMSTQAGDIRTCTCPLGEDCPDGDEGEPIQG